jgi:formamidopyrimidine-DNA glycosylase
VPELPEVETVVQTLRPHLAEVRLTAVWTSGQPLRMARPVDRLQLQRLCVGAQATGVRRRGKYILIDLLQRDAKAGLLVHLGMTGRLRVQDRKDVRAPHTHVIWTLDSGRELRFVDPRRFGWVQAVRDLNELPELVGLGPDPLAELTLPDLRALLARSRAPLKAFLLDQRHVAGLGNIYVCEALFRAGLHPRTSANHAVVQAAELLRGIRAALRAAIKNRGTSLRDFVDSDGGEGNNAGKLLVYGREGELCRRCRTRIQRQVDAGRSTFFCPRCQTVERG